MASFKLITRFYCTIKNLSIARIYESKNCGEKVKIQGWVKSVRKMKENLFFDVNDGSCSKQLQVLVAQPKQPQHLAVGASVVASGLLSVSPKGQPELNAESVEICGKCVVTDGYPFAPKKSYAPEYSRQYPHFRLRTSKFAALLRVRHSAMLEMHNYFDEEGFVHIHTPILTSNDCEGAGEVFTVVPENKKLLQSMSKENATAQEVFFNTEVFLTVSGQLHLEAAAHSLNKVYTFGPTFRAENSKSRLHLSEFYMLEAECAFVDRIETVTNIVEKLIKAVTKKILNKHADDMDKCAEQKLHFAWLDQKFTLLTYDEASRILSENAGRYNSEFHVERGLTKDHEHFLVKHCGDMPTFVINWPREIKPFYARSCIEDASQVAAFDLLVPNVGELVGGSLRENSYKALEERLPKMADLKWYLDVRRFGGVPTGGFGLGFERYLQFILGINNIKDTLPFPRWPYNCRL